MVACTTSEPSDGSPTPEPDAPSPYVVDRPDDEVGSASVRELENALQDALDTVLDLDAAPVHAGYDAAMSASTGVCPYEYVTPDGNYWFDSCSTESGASYDGYVFAYGATGVSDPYSGLSTDYWAAFGGAVVSDAQDNVLEISGAVTEYHAYGVSDGIDLDVYFVDLSGTFRWDGPEARDTWLEGGGYDPDLTWQRTALSQLGVGGVYLAGGFAGLDGDWAVAFDENEVGHELLGYTCERELSGTVSVRAPSGEWYDVRFDGATVGVEVPASDCDGCGEAFSGGTSVGRVCVDVAGMLAKAAQP
jgi:hypothetical protein